MKNVFYLLIFSILTVSFNACKSNNDNSEWQTANDAYYQSIAKDPAYLALTTPTGPTGVYYKVEKTGTGTEHPLQTSTVMVLYEGTFYDKTVFDAGTSNNDVPTSFSLSGSNTIRGFSFALQNMVVGDKWQICIPYYLGYGITGLQDSYYNTIIKPYTTLNFDVELVSITQYP